MVIILSHQINQTKPSESKSYNNYYYGNKCFSRESDEAARQSPQLRLQTHF